MIRIFYFVAILLFLGLYLFFCYLCPITILISVFACAAYLFIRASWAIAGDIASNIKKEITLTAPGELTENKK